MPDDLFLVVGAAFLVRAIEQALDDFLIGDRQMHSLVDCRLAEPRQPRVEHFGLCGIAGKAVEDGDLARVILAETFLEDRSEERGGGKVCVSACRSRWGAYL